MTSIWAPGPTRPRSLLTHMSCSAKGGWTVAGVQCTTHPSTCSRPHTHTHTLTPSAARCLSNKHRPSAHKVAPPPGVGPQLGLGGGVHWQVPNDTAHRGVGHHGAPVERGGRLGMTHPPPEVCPLQGVAGEGGQAGSGYWAEGGERGEQYTGSGSLAPLQVAT